MALTLLALSVMSMDVHALVAPSLRSWVRLSSAAGPSSRPSIARASATMASDSVGGFEQTVPTFSTLDDALSRPHRLPSRDAKRAKKATSIFAVRDTDLASAGVLALYATVRFAPAFSAAAAPFAAVTAVTAVAYLIRKPLVRMFVSLQRAPSLRERPAAARTGRPRGLMGESPHLVAATMRTRESTKRREGS